MEGKRIEVMLTVSYDPQSGDLTAHVSQLGRPGQATDNYEAHKQGEVSAFGRDLAEILLTKLGWRGDDARFALAQKAR